MRIMLVQYYMFHFIVRLMIKMCIFFVMWKSEGEGFWRVQINLEKGRGVNKLWCPLDIDPEDRRNEK